MAICADIKLDGDNFVGFDSVVNAGVTPNVPITGATVSAQLTDVTDPDVPVALLGPIPMPEFPGSPSSSYRATYFADSGAGFFEGQRIRVEVDFDGGPGLRTQESYVAVVRE